MPVFQGIPNFCHAVWSRTIKFSMVTHVEEGPIFTVSSWCCSKGQGPQCSSFWILPYLCWHPLTYNY